MKERAIQFKSVGLKSIFKNWDNSWNFVDNGKNNLDTKTNKKLLITYKTHTMKT